MSDNLIITIGRECGSGGRHIGQALAEKLGVKCYDKELLNLAAKESGLCKELFETHDEKPTSSFLYSLVMDTYSLGYTNSAYMDMPINHKIFLAQFDTIKNLADKESCVIIGRSADYILKEQKPILRIFIYSPEDVRIENVMKSHNFSAEDAKLFITEKDKRYHKRHLALTGSNRGDRHNRDMLIDSSLLGVDGTAELIEEVAKKVFHE